MDLFLGRKEELNRLSRLKRIFHAKFLKSVIISVLNFSCGHYIFILAKKKLKNRIVVTFKKNS
jgi:hypothetical protein